MHPLLTRFPTDRPLAFIALLAACFIFRPMGISAEEESPPPEQAPDTTTDAASDTAPDTTSETTPNAEDQATTESEEGGASDTASDSAGDSETDPETEGDTETESLPAQLSPVLIEGEDSRRLDPVLRPRLAPVLKGDTPNQSKNSREGERLWGPAQDAEGNPALRGIQSVVPPARPAAAPATGSGDPVESTPESSSSGRTKASKADRRLARQLGEGKRLLARGNFASARQTLLQIARRAPESIEAPEALFYAATAQDDLTQVRIELRAVVRKYPRSNATPRALGRIGEISLILGDYGESLSAFRALRRVSRRPEERREASSKIILALVRSGAFEQATDEIESAVAEYPDLRRAPEIIDAHGEALLGAGRYEAGSALLADVESQFPNYEFGAKVLLNRGLCEELAGHTTEARRIYLSVRSRFPDGIESSLAAARLRDIATPLNAPRRGATLPASQIR